MGVILSRDTLDALLQRLRENGRRVIGPTRRDGTITPDEISSLDDLPAGWTEQQHTPAEIQQPLAQRRKRRRVRRGARDARRTASSNAGCCFSLRHTSTIVLARFTCHY